MIIYKPFLEATKNYTQLQLKFVFSILIKDSKRPEIDELDKKDLRNIFCAYKNVPDTAKKIVEGIKTNERKNGNQLFDSIDYLYPCYIGYDLNEKIKKSIDYITFSNSIISQFPNSGNSLRLFLLLLFGFEKNNDTCKFTTTELQTELFMNKKAYRTDTTTNASANQFAKIKQALDVINQIPDYNIDVIPIKTGRTITSFMFENKKQTIYVRTASEELIKKLLAKNGFSYVHDSYISFIALFCTEKEAPKLIKEITKTAKIPLKHLFDEFDSFMFLTFKTLQYQYEQPLWYTVPQILALLECYAYTHPTTYLDDIPKFIAEYKTYTELAEIINKNEATRITPYCKTLLK